MNEPNHQQDNQSQDSQNQDNQNNEQLRESVRCILEVSKKPLTEYQLIQQLNEQGWSLGTSASDSLTLFTTHFLVFNALYSLQAEFWLQQQPLEISALCIQLHPPMAACSEADSRGLDPYASDIELRNYYLDLSQLNNATQESVEELLNQFWDRLYADEDIAKALSILALEEPITLVSIKERYRRLAMIHHPDRGGEESQFQALNWAFGVLQKRCS